MTNREMVQKADMVLGDLATGGLLNPEQEATFFRKVLDQPTIVNEARTVFMSAPKREINKVGFGTRILKSATEAAILQDELGGGKSLAAAGRSSPALSKVTLDTYELIAQVNIPYDVLEDNIEKENFSDTIVEMIAERAALDIEELVLLGDTDTGASDAFLDVLDGVLKQVPAATNRTDATGKTAWRTVFKEGLQKMPTKYLRNRPAMRFYVSHNNEVDYRDELAQRQTGLGDTTITGYNPAYAFGVPVVPIALMPETDGLFIDPKNIIIGFHRRVLVETDKDIRARMWWIVLTLRMDVKLEEDTAAVRITNIPATL